MAGEEDLVSLGGERVHFSDRNRVPSPAQRRHSLAEMCALEAARARICLIFHSDSLAASLVNNRLGGSKHHGFGQCTSESTRPSFSHTNA